MRYRGCVRCASGVWASAGCGERGAGDEVGEFGGDGGDGRGRDVGGDVVRGGWEGV